MTIRQYSSRSQQTTLTGAITSGATSMTVVSGTALLGGQSIPSGRTFTLVIDPDTAIEEIVDATAVATNTFTITRSIDTVSGAQDHSAGAVVRHMAIGRDFRDANLHAEADTYYNDGSGTGHTMHGIASGEGVVVGTLKTQTLTNKTLTSPTISNPTITGTSGVETSIVFEGSTADAHETTLTVVDPTQDNTITLPNTTGTVVIADATQTLTNKTLTSPTISGSPVITGLSSAGMISSSATPKDYVDSILGSATAAATSAASAATSASSAATSASSASTSASSALTSANSASTSATAAATSASSAATSATAAATSATSAAASATAATTSATSAETSATAAATSASSASTSASSALTSANNASTSASSASTSASSAATSASSAATSASSAAATYDQFDDRYLGSKTSDPTVDNDGNPLITGALYFNSVTNAMKVYSGSSWGNVAPDTSNFIDKSILSGKGALISASGASTPVALTAPSTNGWILSGDSATTSGLAWIAPNPGDITGVTASAPLTGGGTSGDVTIGIQDGTTAQKGAVQLEDSTASTSTTTAATPNSVKSAYDLANTANTAASSAQTTANAAVPKSDYTAKGVILAGTGAGTYASQTVGTNNQVLMADSAQSDGVKWANEATATLTAKGDLLGASAANTLARVPVGSNGLYLAADSTQTAGVIWTTVASGSVSGTAKIADQTESGVFTYNITLPAGAYLVNTYNSTGNAGSTSIAGVEISFGTTKYTNAAWTTRPQTPFLRLPIIGYTASQLTSVTINTYPSGSWSDRTYNFGATAPTIQGIVYGNGNFVIFGQVGGGTGTRPYIATSTDGVAWTSRTPSFGNTRVNHMVYGDKFVGVDANGQVSTSTDGVSWTSRFTSPFFTNGTRNNVYYVAGLANPYFLVSEVAGVTYYYHSTDGITWASRAWLNSEDAMGHIAGNQAFSTVKVATFKANGQSVNWYQTSTDGLTWTSRAFPTTYSKNDNGSGLAASTDRYNFVLPNANNWTSTDGITWTAGPTVANIGRTIVWNSAPSVKWLIMNANSYIVASTDGISWYHLSGGRDVTSPFAYGNGLWHGSVEGATNAGSAVFSTSGWGKINGDLYISIQSAGSVTTL